MNEIGSSEYPTTEEDQKYRQPPFISLIIYSSGEIYLDLNFRMIGVELSKSRLSYFFFTEFYRLWTPYYS